jgi:membrane protease YdiL (CAAX protease family)
MLFGGVHTADVNKSANATSSGTRFLKRGQSIRFDLSWTDILPVVLIVLAEISIFVGYRIGCIGLDALNIVVVSLIIVRRHGEHIELIQALALVSVLSLVSLSLPVFTTVTLLWLAAVYAITLLPLIATIRYQKLGTRYVGLIINKATVYLVTLGVFVGVGLGILEYRVLSAGSIAILSPSNLIALSIVMIFFVGLAEELLFRSLLQQRFIERCGVIPGILITSALFGIAHAGFANYAEILYAGIIGVLFGVCFYKTKSLPFVIVMNGVSNVVIFGLIPLGMMPFR